MSDDLLDRLIAAGPEAFALLHRPDSGGAGTVDVLTGSVTTPATLADIPLDEPGPPLPGRGRDRPRPRHEVLAVIPYRQIAERGFTAVDDGAPLIAITITEQEKLPVADVLARLPDIPTRLLGGRFDPSDDGYASTVRRVVTDEIGTGEGANFVIRRSFVVEITDYTPQAALSFFRRLLPREQSAYWTFLIHTPHATLVGATPERHITVDRGAAVMNPISGTYRYPATGPTVDGIKAFLADPKETDELYMVVDEELKMMARICDSRIRAVGPYLKEMARLAHTEYFVEGTTARDCRDILRETMFAPTVTGSPLESATRVIRRYEPQGRRYYSGVAALIGRDGDGSRALDSAILIRTAEIDPGGSVRIDVGATLVRHSDPAAEVAETRAKAEALIDALERGGRPRLGSHPEVQAALRRRNLGIADFWLDDGGGRWAPVPSLTGVGALVIDAEDTFTAMIGHQLRCLGIAVTIRRVDEPFELDGRGLVVLGPGPGDPRAVDDPRIVRLRQVVDQLLIRRLPFMAVCLSHQVLALRLGFDIVRRPVPSQGLQREIDLFGVPERVGFYNTFIAHSPDDRREIDGIGPVEVSRDPATGEVHALRGPHWGSMQFHAESVLTVDGPRIITGVIQSALSCPDRHIALI